MPGGHYECHFEIWRSKTEGANEELPFSRLLLPPLPLQRCPCNHVLFLRSKVTILIISNNNMLYWIRNPTQFNLIQGFFGSSKKKNCLDSMAGLKLCNLISHFYASPLTSSSLFYKLQLVDNSVSNFNSHGSARRILLI